MNILVNSTDSFEDCWDPFFKLFKRYWPNFNGTIYLNTEFKNYKQDGLKIVSICSGLKNSTWSESLNHALDKIGTDTILYLQEDYFLIKPVSNNLVQYFYNEFNDLEIDCLHLTDQCTPGPLTRKNSKLMQVQNQAPYFVSTQAAFWRPKALQSIIRHYETGWEFEKYGTRRAAKLNLQIYCVDPEIYGVGREREIIPYVFTGIIKGRWNPVVEQIFESHGINVDFRNRGFNFEEKLTLLRKIRTVLKMLKSILKSASYGLRNMHRK